MCAASDTILMPRYWPKLLHVLPSEQSPPPVRQIFCQQRPPEPGDGVNRSKFTFQNMVMLHIKLRISLMQQHGSNILPSDPPLNPRDGVSRSKFNFLEHSHVTYQIKENHECSSMVANILLADTPRPWGLGK